jgi:hypothetical protein
MDRAANDRAGDAEFEMVPYRAAKKVARKFTRMHRKPSGPS